MFRCRSDLLRDGDDLLNDAMVRELGVVVCGLVL